MIKYIWKTSVVSFFALFLSLAAAAQPLTKISQETSAQCLDTAMQRLGISLDLQSDPALLADILKNEMFLSDLPSIQNLLAPQMASPLPLGPMIAQIRASILEKHPAVSEFVCQALAKNLITHLSDNTYVIRTIHHMFLLETIIGAMYSDHNLMIEMGDHFQAKRVELGARPDFIGSSIDIAKASGNLFFMVKAKTIDAVFKRLERIRSENFLSRAEAEGSKGCLILNITEAVVTDNTKGRRANGLVGTGLALNPLEKVVLEDDERILRYHLQPEWTSLYETWNLAFITGEMDNLHLLYPKLLIPRIVNADSNEYMFNRTLALWTGINFYLLNKLAGYETVNLPKAKELAALWGDINLKYAKAYVKETNGVDLESFAGRLKTGIVQTAQELIALIRNPFAGVPRVCF